MNPFRDRQQDRPISLCARCGKEQYSYDKVVWKNGWELCQTCAQEESQLEEENMTLLELSVEYRAQAGRLRHRIKELESVRQEQKDSAIKGSLDYRIRILSDLWREARDLAVLTERYYERGYRRNARYTL